jgi:hypothetical protein
MENEVRGREEGWRKRRRKLGSFFFPRERRFFYSVAAYVGTRRAFET